MYDLIIIGGGPAGLTAALFSGRSRLRTLILEKMGVGGRILLTDTIENFPGFVGEASTEELIKRMEEQVKSLGVEIKLEEVIDIDCKPPHQFNKDKVDINWCGGKQKSIKTNVGTYAADSIIIATGARQKKLGVSGEDRLIGRGVSYCATCDAPFYKEKNVVVVGGGNAVAEEALYLTRFAKQVTIVHRREDLRASAILQERLKVNKKINFVLSNVVTEIIGLNKVESIKLKDVNTSQERNIPCDGVFIFIGYEPETGFLKNKLKLDDVGFIISDENMTTSQEGIFAAGDVTDIPYKQIVVAAGMGALAALAAIEYLNKK